MSKKCDYSNSEKSNSKCSGKQTADSNNSSKSENSDKKDKKFEEYIKSEDISLANLEKIGAAFLVFGYANYIRAAQVDILDALDLNKCNLSAADITVFGQRSVLLGYTILTIVASQRLQEKQLENKVTGEDINFSPYYAILTSYLISIYANSLRLSAFMELAKENPTGEVIQ